MQDILDYILIHLSGKKLYESQNVMKPILEGKKLRN